MTSPHLMMTMMTMSRLVVIASSSTVFQAVPQPSPLPFHLREQGTARGESRTWWRKRSWSGYVAEYRRERIHVGQLSGGLQREAAGIAPWLESEGVKRMKKRMKRRTMRKEKR